jgi:hypothetical protein
VIVVVVVAVMMIVIVLGHAYTISKGPAFMPSSDL